MLGGLFAGELHVSAVTFMDHNMILALSKLLSPRRLWQKCLLLSPKLVNTYTYTYYKDWGIIKLPRSVLIFRVPSRLLGCEQLALSCLSVVRMVIYVHVTILLIIQVYITGIWGCRDPYTNMPHFTESGMMAGILMLLTAYKTWPYRNNMIRPWVISPLV